MKLSVLVCALVLCIAASVNSQTTPTIEGNDCPTSTLILSFSGATGNYIQLSTQNNSVLYTELNISLAGGNSQNVYFTVYSGENYYLNQGRTPFPPAFSTSTCSITLSDYANEAVHVYNIARSNSYSLSTVTQSDALDNVARVYYITNNITESAALGNYQATGSLGVYVKNYALGTPVNPGAAIQSLIYDNPSLINSASWTQIGAYLNQTDYGVTGVSSTMVLIVSQGGTSGTTTTNPPTSGTTVGTTTGSAGSASTGSTTGGGGGGTTTGGGTTSKSTTGTTNGGNGGTTTSTQSGTTGGGTTSKSTTGTTNGGNGGTTTGGGASTTSSASGTTGSGGQSTTATTTGGGGGQSTTATTTGGDGASSTTTGSVTGNGGGGDGTASADIQGSSAVRLSSWLF